MEKITIINSGSEKLSQQNSTSALKCLNEELESIIRRKTITDKRIKELNNQLRVYEARLESINESLSRSWQIAEQLEANGQSRASSILAEAETALISRQNKLNLVEQEIAELTSTLDYYNKLVLKERLASSQQKTVKPYGFADPETISSKTVSAPVFAEDEAIYSMKLVLFINARHFVTFGNTTGPVHAHSWQLELGVSVPTFISETIEFTSISRAISEVLSPYENVILNNISPFDVIQPTTENIAMYFFNLIEDTLNGMELGLAQLSLWETPTRGIQVTNRNTELDQVITGSKELCEVGAAEQQAALTSEPEEENVVEETASKTLPKLPRLQDFIYPPGSFPKYALGFIIITAAALFAYHNLIWPPADHFYPWGSDSWGHLFKAEYLYDEILKGNYYPQFTEYWYNGNQPFRYWAPLPYYILVLLRFFTGNIFIAGNLYIFVCALFGGLSWLLLSRRMGFWPAVIAGVIWVVWLDNVRVACSEGNLPRVLATALLPLLFILFLKLMERKKCSYAVIASIVLVHTIILCHAVIGAVYCSSLILFSFLLWSFGGCRLKDCLVASVVLGLGTLSSFWWLLPSLTGGITEIDIEAVKNALQFVPATVSFNPVYHFNNQESFYWGISLLIALVVTFATWRSKPAWAKALAVCGTLFIIMTLPLMRSFYTVLPFSHVLWPLRFSSFASMSVLGAALAFNPHEQRIKGANTFVAFAIVIGLGALLLIDCGVSLPLMVHTGSQSPNLAKTSDFIKQDNGWRVATVDLSQLGSAPSYSFSEIAGKEQVFGWAWQGAVTSNNIMLINTGLESQYYPFLLRSCVDLGATDLVIKQNVIKKPQLFSQAATQAGYKYINTIGNISIWHSIDQPYLIEKKPQCLVIGKYSGTVGLQFPEVEMGFSNHLDKYSAKDLKQYSKLILSGATWSSKNRAEKIIKDYIASGGQVFVELAGIPENVLAKQPEFLGVYGETVSLRGGIEIQGGNAVYQLHSFSPDMPVWNAYVPMGLDKVLMSFSYYGNDAPVYGYKLVNGEKVWFLGGNLIYHSFKTGDPVAVKLLTSVLKLKTTYSGEQLIPLTDYQVNKNGYSMKYSSDHRLKAVLPVAAIDGTRVKVDNQIYPAETYENLLQLDLPAGTHQIKILLVKTPIYRWGEAISLMVVILLIPGLILWRRMGDDSL